MSDLKIVLAGTRSEAERYAQEQGWARTWPRLPAGTVRWLDGCTPIAGYGVESEDDIVVLAGFWQRRDAAELYERARLRINRPQSMIGPAGSSSDPSSMEPNSTSP